MVAVTALMGADKLGGLVERSETLAEEGLEADVEVETEGDLKQELFTLGHLPLIIVVGYHQLPKLKKILSPRRLYSTLAKRFYKMGLIKKSVATSLNYLKSRFLSCTCSLCSLS